MKTILIILLTAFVPLAATAKTKSKKPNKTLTFAELAARAEKLPQKKQVVFWKQYAQFTAEFEKQAETGKKTTRLDFFIDEAFADSVWCVNNGFFAQVDSCDQSNNWSFDVRATQDFKTLTSSGVTDTCPEGQSPCSLVGGLTETGGLYCSNNSTRSCINGATQGGYARLAKAVSLCQGHNGVRIGGTHIKCAPLLASLKAQASAMDASCSGAVHAVQNLCNASREQLGHITNNDPVPPLNIPTPPPDNTPPPVTGDHSSDVLFIGDSNAATDASRSSACFGAELYDKMTQKGDGNGHPLTVQMDAMCLSSAQLWLKSSVPTGCGYRECTPGQACTSGASYTAPNVDALLAKSKPRATVVQLGTNMLGIGWSGANGNEAAIKSIIDKITAAGSRCVWVGPPQPGQILLQKAKMNFNDYLNFVQKMKSVVTAGNRCTFVDSAGYTDWKTIPASDPYGAHYPCAQSAAWADGVFNDQITHSLEGLHPIADEAAPTDQ